MVYLHQLKGLAFLTWYVKGVPFANRRYTKEVKELDLGAETLRITHAVTYTGTA